MFMAVKMLIPFSSKVRSRQKRTITGVSDFINYTSLDVLYRLSHTTLFSDMYSHRLIILAIAIGLCSCKELYDEYHAEISEEYLVGEGMISDDPGPYYITISKAIPYSNDLELYNYNPEIERNAVVKIRSDKGEEVVLSELPDN